MYKKQRSGLPAAISLGLLALIVLGASQYQLILDEYALSTYQPRAEVVSFMSRVELTREARAIFYRADPRYDSKSTFNQDCETRPHELELGCYFRSRIYVLKIENAALASEMDVVSAHELLHAAWQRLSAKERSDLATELNRVYAGMTDNDLRQRMASYAKSEPGEEANELHSILGTEYPSLSPKLEAHYAKYFPKREQILAAHTAYESVFANRRAELERQLAGIRSEKAQLSVINRQLDSLKASGQISAYNDLVPKQNRLVDDINRKIADYRAGVDEYNALSKSLDSTEITDTETSAQ